jgi:uncharacterized protein (TIGR03437 family)
VSISRSLSVLVLSLLSLAGSLAAQTLSVSATSLSFSSALGGASQTQTLNVTSSGASLTFAIFPNVSWLTTTPNSGSTPSAVTVTVNPSSLPAGTYNGTLEIINVNTPSNTVYVAVTLVVSAVGASPSAVSFSYQFGASLPATQGITLTGSATTFTASSSAPWLTVTASGNVPGLVAVSLNSAANSLAAGTDNATITITPATGSPISIAVTLSVTAEATVTASSSSLSFDYQIGGANNTVSQTITLSATGTATQSYSITPSVNPNPSGQDWILVNPSSGTIPGGGSVQVTISFNTLVSGSFTTTATYPGSLSISTPTAIAPPNIPVSLLVSNSPLLSVPSSTLSFLYEVSGSTPAAQSVTAVSTNVAASSTTGQLPIAVSATTTSGGSWLAVTPANTVTGTPFSVSVNNLAGLGVNTYDGTVTVTPTGAGNGAQTIPVVLTVANDSVPLLTPAALSFVYEVGKSQPGTQSLSLTSSTGAGLNYSATAASTQCGGAWLSLSGNASGSVSGTTAGTFAASASTTGLTTSETCAGTITVTATNPATGAPAPGSPVTIPVTLYVSTNPLLVTSPSSLSFTAQVSGSAPAAQTIALSSTDSSVVLNYTVSPSPNGSWLSVNQTTGSTASGSNLLTVSVNPLQFSAATYTGTITITATGSATVANSPVIIPVTFQVTSATLFASPTSLAFAATAGGSAPAAPASQSLQITTNGSPVNYTAVANVTGTSTAWLSVTPATGTTPATLTVNASGINLPAATYSGSVTVSAPNTAPVNVPVTLTVNAGSISASPTSLSFTEAAGAPTPATQTLTVTVSPSSLNYTVSVSMASGSSANWLGASVNACAHVACPPPSGINAVTVSASSAALAPGAYTGSVIITSTGATGSPITIPVSLTVVPAQSLAVTPSSLTFNDVLNASAPAAQTATVTTSGGPAPFTVATQTADGGTWLQVTPTSGTTPSTLSISIATAGLAAGNYSGTVTVSSTSATQTAVITVSMTVAAVPMPLIGGVANAGSYAPGSVAPGENIWISGTGLGPATLVGLQLTSSGSVATTVSNTQVTFDGFAAPIIYVSANQTSVMVPFEVGGRPTTVLQVSYMGVKSAPVTYNVSAAAPGIYTQNSEGFGPGSILNQNYTLNGPSEPASAGSYVAVYLSGAGNTSPTGTTGAVIPTNGTGLKTIALPVSVTIGGLPAAVAYYGSAPGDVEGVMQINVQIPSGLIAGAQPIVITLGSGNSTYSTQNGVTVQVH